MNLETLNTSGGGMIVGTWQNTRTGEIVTVRDSYIDGDELTIILTNGRQLSMSEFADYVQLDESAQDLMNMQEDKKESDRRKLLFDGMNISERPESKQNTNKQLIAQLGDESLTMIDQDVSAGTRFNEKDTPMYNEDRALYENSLKKQEKSKNVEMVENVLSKSQEPLIEIKVKWPEYPRAALDTLKTYFSVTDEDIIEAIVNMYGNVEVLKDALSKWDKAGNMY